MTVVLETPRLRLRAWVAADLLPFAALNADPEVMEHFPSPLDRAASDGLAERIRGNLAANGWGLWAAEVRPDVEGPTGFIGFIGLAEPRFDAHFTPAVEIGWRLAREAWGRGFATEGAQAALTYAFEGLGLDEVVSFTVPGNVRSRRVMAKLGLGHDPGDDFDHPKLPEGHAFRRHVLYRIARRGWVRPTLDVAWK